MAILPELVTARLVLRRLDFTDAAFIAQLLNEPSFLQNIGDRGVRTEEDAPRYLREGPMAMYAKYGFGLWHVSLKSDGTPIGMCGLLKRDTLPDADIGYAYLPAHWGKGYALEAAEATLRQGAERFGLRRVIAVVSPGNVGSIRVLEKIGMQFERMHSMSPDEPDVRLYGRAL
ncbi:MAG: GNAT family N-acetyltransferase [Steroidobacteraceae bacterium]|nr:GNAT family N-acetyltransferase [Steroidobacteraceae bacterium]